MVTKEMIEKFVEDYQSLKKAARNEPTFMETLRRVVREENNSEDLIPWLEYMTEKNERISGLQEEKDKLEERIKSLKKPENDVGSDTIQRLKTIKKKMTIDFYLFWRRKRKSTTELYYNWLLKDVETIDGVIPGFSNSWKAYRREFNGLFGLVRAAEKVISKTED